MMLAASRLVVQGGRRAVTLAGRRQAAVQTIRRTAARGIQSVAQTDRVCLKLFISDDSRS